MFKKIVHSIYHNQTWIVILTSKFKEKNNLNLEQTPLITA